MSYKERNESPLSTKLTTTSHLLQNELQQLRLIRQKAKELQDNSHFQYNHYSPPSILSPSLLKAHQQWHQINGINDPLHHLQFHKIPRSSYQNIMHRFKGSIDTSGTLDSMLQKSHRNRISKRNHKIVESTLKSPRSWGSTTRSPSSRSSHSTPSPQKPPRAMFGDSRFDINELRVDNIDDPPEISKQQENLPSQEQNLQLKEDSVKDNQDVLSSQLQSLIQKHLQLQDDYNSLKQGYKTQADELHLLRIEIQELKTLILRQPYDMGSQTSASVGMKGNLTSEVIGNNKLMNINSIHHLVRGHEICKTTNEIQGSYNNVNDSQHLAIDLKTEIINGANASNANNAIDAIDAIDDKSNESYDTNDINDANGSNNTNGVNDANDINGNEMIKDIEAPLIVKTSFIATIRNHPVLQRYLDSTINYDFLATSSSTCNATEAEEIFNEASDLLNQREISTAILLYNQVFKLLEIYPESFAIDITTTEKEVMTWLEEVSLE